MRTLLLVVALALACSRLVVGLITPEHFQFAEVVHLDDDGDPGGWQAVCILATMRNGNTGQDMICDFQVELPLRTREQGIITQELARTAAATAANKTAYQLLSQLEAGEMLGMICQRFRPMMQAWLGTAIRGARVMKCDQKKGVPTVRFDEPTLYYP